MPELKDNQLLLVDDEGNEIVCNIIFTFESEATNKKYVIFQAENDDTDEIGAASYIETEGGQGTLEPIETEEEWELIQDAVNSFIEESEEEKE